MSGNVNCPTSQSVQVSVNPNPTVTAVATTSLICRGTTNTLTGVGATNYNWGAAGTGPSIVVQPTVTTNYTLTGTDANGCEGQGAVVVFVSGCNSISDVAKNSNLVSVYPNPTNSDITVKAEVAMRLQLVNALGQIVLTIELNTGNNFQANVNELSPGVYFLVGEANAVKLNEKIVVTK